MITTKTSIELRKEILPNNQGAGGGTVSILQMPSGKIVIKRFVHRNKVVNVVDRYELIGEGDAAEIQTLPLTREVADRIVDTILSGRKSWSACFVIEANPKQHEEINWVKSESEHKFTSTGIKFWRHQEAMESYRDSTGRSIISTHISPEGACNLKCPYCSVTYRDTHSRIALPRIQKYVTDLKSRGLKAVILTGGGEPTIYPHFNQLVQWLKHEQGLSVALITNGTLSKRVEPETWKCFSWVRVSINIFDGWEEKIGIDPTLLSPDCVVGCSTVYSVEHEATNEEVPLDRLELFAKISKVADRCGAKYIRVLPNCLLEQNQLILEHKSIQKIAEKLGDTRYFQQYKVHGAPDSDVCHQSYFRPYLSEEPYHEDGEPGTVYPCDSVVLNNSQAFFAKQYQLCKPENVLEFMDQKIQQQFNPREACKGCVFTGNVNQLKEWKESGKSRFSEFPSPLVHEEFV
ncbi:MAG: radical SAM protein [Spirochaetes bacterium]|nr:MAG: radical SAM protein [Spirochaetota bacterium]